MHGYDSVRKGDPDAAFAAAAHVFEHTFYTPRYHAGYIEPRATLVWIDDGGTFHVVCTNKNPFALRDNLAATLELAKEQIVIESTYIGGEFGAKALTIEEFSLYFLARATNRAVKHVRTHADDVRSSHVRHAAKVRARIATSDDGAIQALDLRVLFDGGAYAGGKGLPWLVPGRTPKIPYAIPSANVERMAVYTNTIPAGIVRAPADVQTLFAVESMIDMIAEQLGIDPLEMRMRNAIAPGDTDLENNPYAEPRGREVLAALREAIGWDTPPAPGRGRGIAFTARHIAGGKTSLYVTAQEDGTIAVETGSTEPGVGTLTVIQRVLAAELGIEPERVTVVRGTTATAPWDPGSGGSKGPLLLGQAALDAARKLRLALALPHDGPVRVVGEFEFVHKKGEPLWVNFGAYGVELSVDRETGQLTIHDVTFVGDFGAIINPIAHRGQVDGGFLLGLGHALMEELIVEDGRIVNIALSEYKLPTQRDMPPFRVIELPRGGGPGPYGARAVGEMNSAGVAPAIANAIRAACGVRLDRLALTAERIYAALQATP
jgi:CO/xanthine dehydrogenase Mo-binding subunit